MILEPLSPAQTAAARSLVDESIERLPDSSGRNGYVRGGVYGVTWTLTALSQESLERAAWLLGQLGFELQPVLTRHVVLPGSVLPETYFSVLVSRAALFHPDYLFGEALLITTVASGWDSVLDSFDLDNSQSGTARAGRSLYGPMGHAIA